MAVGIAVLAANAVAAVWGGIAWLRGVPSVIFWYLLRVAQAVVILQVALGLFLLIGQGHRAANDLHYAYGVSLLVVALVAEAFRAGVAAREIERRGIEDVEALERRDQVLLARAVVRNEMGIMTMSVIAVVTLALRAFATGS
jgi:ABC-type amino acid transport system permease subunit